MADPLSPGNVRPAWITYFKTKLFLCVGASSVKSIRRTLFQWAPVFVLAALAGGCSGVTSSGSSEASARLDGAGSSFVAPIMQKWSKVYHDEKGVEVDYQSIGSGGGIQKLLDHTVDFGCSDAPLSDEQLKRAMDSGGKAIHVPLVMGGIVAAYNLKDVEKPLRFTGPVLADIFLGKIKKWDDPALKELNPGVTLPDLEIAVVHRSDGSGTTFAWTDYLSKVSEEWKTRVGTGTSVRWPCGVGQKGNEGVSGHVGRTAGAIGYVELIYALQNNIPYGWVRNKAGEFVEPTLQSINAAAASALATIPADLRYTLTEVDGKDAYPICATVWAIVFADQSPAKTKTLVDFLSWIAHAGQKYTKELHYAALPPALVERVDGQLQLIKNQ
jgi:phosphate transport system substrate-binding protein